MGLVPLRTVQILPAAALGQLFEQPAVQVPVDRQQRGVRRQRLTAQAHILLGRLAEGTEWTPR